MENIDVKKEQASEVSDVAENIKTVQTIAVQGTTITEDQLIEYKEKYKKVFRTQLADEIFVWRRLDRKSFSEIISETKAIENEEERVEAREKAFCEVAVLFPVKEDFAKLAEDEDMMITGLSEEILFKSGFVPPRTEQL